MDELILMKLHSYSILTADVQEEGNPVQNISRLIIQGRLLFLTYLARKDREIWSHDGARFPCLRTGV